MGHLQTAQFLKVICLILCQNVLLFLRVRSQPLCKSMQQYIIYNLIKRGEI